MLKKEVEEAKKFAQKTIGQLLMLRKKSIEEIAATALEYLKIFRQTIEK